MTLLETNPLRNGLQQRTNMDVTASCTSSQREQLSMMARNPALSTGGRPFGSSHDHHNIHYAADTVTIGGSASSSLLVGGVPGEAQTPSRQSGVRKTKTLSNCNCQLDSFAGQFLLCKYAKAWITAIETFTYS